jgi:hypothetical protein
VYFLPDQPEVEEKETYDQRHSQVSCFAVWYCRVRKAQKPAEIVPADHEPVQREVFVG